MKRPNFSVLMATLVMETVSDLQKAGLRSAVRDIKARIIEKYGNASEKYLSLVPQYIKKGLSLGLIARYGDNYRTKMYLAKRRSRRSKHRRRRRRRKIV
ncbi:hypothetical protein TcasGA2_TC014778 [Tribolium castaneum]|uniref:H15 domain-containing protein n=1 Tax=Tribolium castaneum TaxID=7070 RepID=D6WJP2_TRICA|nr:hypothetical protein TcasGA2_TC014778 [Tribolium castaneum]